MAVWWSKLSLWQKRATTVSGLLASIVAIGGIIWSGATVIATDKEVESKVATVKQELYEHINKQVESERRAQIQRAKAEIRQIDFQLLDENLPFDKRTFLTQSKQELKDLIICVQNGNSLCDQ